MTTDLQTLRHEDELREAFVETLLHDLRGPLTVALTSLGMLAESVEAPSARYLALRAHRAIVRADDLLRDLLDVSRVRAGQPLPLHLGDCDFSALVLGVVDELSGRGRFSLDVDHNLRGVWSPRELRRAVWNLVSNALQHGDGQRPVTVCLHARDGEVRLSVHNFGHAIEPRSLDRVFEAHFHGDAGEGWGLGLALVRACAEAHGGRVEVQSTEQEGTTFTVALPLDARVHCEHSASR